MPKKPSSPKNPQQKTYQVQIPPEIRPGKYSNVFGIHLRPREVTIDFGFSQPNTPNIDIVSRIILNYETAEEFMRTLQNTLLDWRNKQKNQPPKKP